MGQSVKSRALLQGRRIRGRFKGVSTSHMPIAGCGWKDSELSSRGSAFDSPHVGNARTRGFSCWQGADMGYIPIITFQYIG
jgi:hypothetical protein